MTKRKERGFTLIAVAAGIIFLVTVVGLSVDIGRIYIAKSETQVFTDSASLAATMELDGTLDGLNRARARAAANPNKWNFNSGSFSSATTAFAKDRTGPWEEFPNSAGGYKYARASANVEVPLTFLGIFKGGQTAQTTPLAFLLAPSLTTSVKADSAAGQEFKTRFREGVFPFSPYAHNDQAPHYGLIPGQLYTLRWASNPRLGNNVCPGDNFQQVIDLAESGGGSERGYIEETSSAVIRASIVGDYQTVWRGIGESVNMTGGSKQTQLDALLTRVGQDTNTNAPNYTSYISSAKGSGRRIVGAPINTGAPDYRVVQIGAFFLLPDGSYEQGGNNPWCAEYLGPWVQGAKNKGAGEAGPHVVRIAK